ncbi:MAG: hypothetical protein U0575_05650 [Phycisphaerales bacterium]
MKYDTNSASMILLPPPSGYSQFWLYDMNEELVVTGGLVISATGSGNPGVACGSTLFDPTIGVPGAIQASYGTAVGADGTIFAECSGLMVQVFAPSPSSPDIDCDGLVGPADLGVLLAAWGGSGPADLDADGAVGGGDLGILLGAWSM